VGAALAIGASTLGQVPRRVRVAMGWTGLIAIACAAVLFSGATPFPGYAALLPAGGAALLIAAGLGQQARLALGRVLSIAPLRYIGDRSYAFYLWHWPVLVLAAERAGHRLSL